MHSLICTGLEAWPVRLSWQLKDSSYENIASLHVFMITLKNKKRKPDNGNTLGIHNCPSQIIRELGKARKI